MNNICTPCAIFSVLLLVLGGIAAWVGKKQAEINHRLDQQEAEDEQIQSLKDHYIPAGAETDPEMLMVLDAAIKDGSAHFIRDAKGVLVRVDEKDA